MPRSDNYLDINIGQNRRLLFMPVIARAIESERTHPLLIDTTSVEILNRVNFDFRQMKSGLSELSRIASIARDVRYDKLIKDFIRRYPDSTIVHIGCGLDTTFERLKNTSVKWFDLDLPDVIRFRKTLMSETLNRKFLSASFLDNDWFKHIDFPDHVLFFSTGVFYHYEERSIRTFIVKLALKFPFCEMIFDVTSGSGVRALNKKIKRSGAGDKYLLRWGLKNTSVIMSWSRRLILLGKYLPYKEEGLSLNLWYRFSGWVSDLREIQYIVHIKAKPDYKHLKLHTSRLK